jgi:hypothetical protein
MLIRLLIIRYIYAYMIYIYTYIYIYEYIGESVPQIKEALGVDIKNKNSHMYIYINMYVNTFTHN